MVRGRTLTGAVVAAAVPVVTLAAGLLPTATPLGATLTWAVNSPLDDPVVGSRALSGFRMRPGARRRSRCSAALALLAGGEAYSDR